MPRTPLAAARPPGSFHFGSRPVGSIGWRGLGRSFACEGMAGGLATLSPSLLGRNTKELLVQNRSVSSDVLYYLTLHLLDGKFIYRKVSGITQAIWASYGRCPYGATYSGCLVGMTRCEAWRAPARLTAWAGALPESHFACRTVEEVRMKSIISRTQHQAATLYWLAACECQSASFLSTFNVDTG